MTSPLSRENGPAPPGRKGRDHGAKVDLVLGKRSTEPLLSEPYGSVLPILR
jgi:hypothetical protein